VDLLALSEVRWGYFRTRKQFLLSRFPDRWRVFFAQPPGSEGDDPWTPRREGNVTCFTVPFLKPSTRQPLYNLAAATAPGRALIEAAAARHLRSMLAKLGVARDPVLMVSNIYSAGLLPSLERRLAVYDYNDNPFQFAGSPSWARGYWRRALAQSDLIFAVSEYYRRQLAAETDKPVIRLGNGVEFDHFARPRPVPDALERLPRPRIVYLGLLSHFLDFDALEALRQARRGGTLVLIGPRSPATEARVRDLASREGVALLPACPYAEAPAHLQACDVGVIPFRALDPFVQGINPNKVYQYLASGLPVVTTPLLDLSPAVRHLQFASEPQGFAAAVGVAIDEARDPEACRALARPYDWNAIAARMVSEIERRIDTRS
jgi:glycosyltransferase involved in cell wall biosynthesis